MNDCEFKTVGKEIIAETPKKEGTKISLFAVKHMDQECKMYVN